MPYASFKIANFFLGIAFAKYAEITPLKLQKLLYFAHGWHLVLEESGQPLLRENIEAWTYGPVVPSVYHEFKEFQNTPIDKYAYDMTSDFKLIIPKLFSEEVKILNSLLNKVWEIYAHHPATHLSNLTHLPGTPWRVIYERYGGNIPQDTVIDNDSIKKHFQLKLNG